MNWRRGLFRVWVVASAAWLMYLGIEIPWRNVTTTWFVLKALSFAVVPPAAVLGLWFLGTWVGRGFRKSN